jgi:hypothetical protein
VLLRVDRGDGERRLTGGWRTLDETDDAVAARRVALLRCLRIVGRERRIVIVSQRLHRYDASAVQDVPRR